MREFYPLINFSNQYNELHDMKWWSALFTNHFVSMSNMTKLLEIYVSDIYE